MKCIHCGQEHAEGVFYCPNTGKPLASPAEETITKFQPVIQQEPTPEKKSSRKIWLWIIAAVLVVVCICLAAGGALIWQSRKGVDLLSFLSTKTSTPTPTQTVTMTPTASPTPTLGIGSTFTRSQDEMQMVYVPAGSFPMGLSEEQTTALLAESWCGNCLDLDFASEKPVHEAYLDAFWIDQYEVTNEQFEQFVNETNYITSAEIAGSSLYFSDDNSGWDYSKDADWKHPQGPSSSINGLEDHPVVHMSWYDAAAYCEWAGGRLPSEAEWEKAAHGTDAGLYPWGDETLSGELANLSDLSLHFHWSYLEEDDGYKYTSPVGAYPAGASPYGAFDMAGNAMEWVSDWYDFSYYAVSPSENPVGPLVAAMRSARGSAWGSILSNNHSSFRNKNIPGFSADGYGFRCVMEADSTTGGSNAAEEDGTTALFALNQALAEYNLLQQRDYFGYPLHVYYSDRADPEDGQNNTYNDEYSGIYVDEFLETYGSETITVQQTLISTIGGMRSPRFSPDGQNAAYLHYEDVGMGIGETMMTNIQSGRTTILTDGTGELSWSLDGRMLAICDTWETLTIVDVESQETRVLDWTDRWCNDLSWSPDATKIAVIEYIGDNANDKDGRVLRIYDITTDNASYVQVTEVRDQRAIAGPINWTPDGEFVVYKSYPLDETGSKIGDYELWRVNSSGLDAEIVEESIAVLDQRYYPWLQIRLLEDW